MDFLGDSLRSASADVLRTKINAEISLIEQKVRQRKQAFGVEVYDLITAASKVQCRRNVWSTLCSDKLVPESQTLLSDPHQDARREISVLLAENEALKDDLDILMVRQSQTISPKNQEMGSASEHSYLSTNSANTGGGGRGGPGSRLLNWRKATSARVRDAGRQTKIRLEMKKIDRDIIQRKQSFGIEMYDALQSTEKEMTWHNRDNEVFECYTTAKNDIQQLNDRIETKKEAIRDLYRVEI